MSSVWLEGPSTHPTNDSSTGPQDKTLVRAPTPPPERPDDDDEAHDPPIVHWIRTRDRSQGLTKPGLRTTADRPAALPIGVLTSDQVFADQIRSALDSTTTVTAVQSIDDVEALAIAGRCPIVVTDLAITRSAIEPLARRVRTHDPATAIVIAGGRDQSALFIGLQSSGAIDAFLLKPITAASAQLVIEAASRRYRTYVPPTSGFKSHPLAIAEDLESTIETKRAPQRSPVAPASIAISSPIPAKGLRPSWSFVLAILIIAAGVVWWSMQSRSGSVDTIAIVTKHLALAESALTDRRLLDPRDGAAHHYQIVLELDPNNVAAYRGLDAVARELSKDTQAYMLQLRLPDAAMALEQLRELQPNYAELPLLDSQFRQLQEQLVASHASDQERVREVTTERESVAPKRGASPVSLTSKSEQASLKRTTSIPATTAPDTQSARRTLSNTSAPTPQIEVPTAVTSQRAVAPTLDEVQPATAPPSAPVEALTASVEPSRALGVANPDPPVPQPAAPSTTDTMQPQPPSATGPETLVKYVEPRYPSDAYARQMEGWIEISMEIAPSGDVIAPRIEDGAKRQLFGRAALTAVRQWKYAPDPTRTPGQRSTVKVEFRLK